MSPDTLPWEQALIRQRHDRLIARWRRGKRAWVGGEEITFDLVRLGVLGRCVETELRPCWQEGDEGIERYAASPAGEWWNE